MPDAHSGILRHCTLEILCELNAQAVGDGRDHVYVSPSHNTDPDRFVVPPTWRRADVESDIPTAMPSADDIRRSMGADDDKAKQLYNEFADYAAQRLSEYDRRDREHLDAICTEVEEIMAGMRMKHIEQNDYVYISVRAAQQF